MDTFIELFQGIPGVLFISIFFGSVALIRTYFLISPDIRRYALKDRRQSTEQIEYPITDCNNNTVNNDRRINLERRVASCITNNHSYLLIKNN